MHVAQMEKISPFQYLACSTGLSNQTIAKLPADTVERMHEEPARLIFQKTNGA